MSGFGASVRRRSFGASVSAAGLLASQPYVELDFAAGLYWSAGEGRAAFADLPGFGFSRAGTGLAETEAGAYQSFASGVPRITDKGFLVETAATNILLWAATLSNAAWIKQTVTIGTGDVGPRGAAMSRVVETGTTTTTYSVRQQVAAAGGSPFTLSFAIKKQGRRYVQAYLYGETVADRGRVVIDLDTGQISNVASNGLFTATSANVRALGGGVWLVDLTTTPDAAQTVVTARLFSMQSPGAAISATVGIDGAAFDVDFLQVEAGSIATSPIITTSASATRPADAAHLDIPAVSAPCTLLQTAEIEAVDETATRYLGVLTKTDNNERIRLYRAPSGAASARAEAGGSGVLNVTASGKTGPRVLKMAAATDGTDWRVSIDGQTVAATPAAGPSGMTRLHLGSLVGSSQFNGWVRRARVWRRALTQDELNGETA